MILMSKTAVAQGLQKHPAPGRTVTIYLHASKSVGWVHVAQSTRVVEQTEETGKGRAGWSEEQHWQLESQPCLGVFTPGVWIKRHHLNERLPGFAAVCSLWVLMEMWGILAIIDKWHFKSHTLLPLPFERTPPCVYFSYKLWIHFLKICTIFPQNRNDTL